MLDIKIECTNIVKKNEKTAFSYKKRGDFTAFSVKMRGQKTAFSYKRGCKCVKIGGKAPWKG
jgi:hypothetical protein